MLKLNFHAHRLPFKREHSIIFFTFITLHTFLQLQSKLIESMREKISELREQEQEIADEIKGNEELGKKVLGMVETKATQSEFSKYELFIGELNKIVALLLSLTQRLHRYEMNLQDLDMSNESDKLKKV